MTRHMIDDDIHDDVDSGGVATGHHGLELLLVAGSGDEVVRNGLVSSPPAVRVVMFHRRRDLS